MPLENSELSFVEFQRQELQQKIVSHLRDLGSREEALQVLDDILSQLYDNGQGSISKEDEQVVRERVAEKIDLIFPVKEADQTPLRDKIFGPKGVISWSFLGKAGLKAEVELSRRDNPEEEHEEAAAKLREYSRLLNTFEGMSSLPDDQKIRFVGLLDEIKQTEADLKAVKYQEEYFSYKYQRKDTERKRLLDLLREQKRRKRRLDMKFFGKYIEFY